MDLIAHLRRVMPAGSEEDLTDGQLLEDYIRYRKEVAVAALVQRHGQMVWGVCRRVLRNHHDAEDAFQATFLVLIRKAESIVPREMVGNWLYGVAHLTALKARGTIAKRQSKEGQATEIPERETMHEPDLWHDLEPFLDQELSRLPDKYRAVIVLCDLEGKTRKEVAHQLKIPEGTLSSRLTTARTMLAKRLAKHGLLISVGVLADTLSARASMARVPATALSSAIKAASLLAAGQVAATESISIRVFALTEGVIKSMLLSKLKNVLVTLLLVIAVLAAGTLTVQTKQSRSAAAEDRKPEVAGDNAQKKGEVVTVQASHVISVFYANDAAADEQFVGKELQVNGSIDRIRRVGEKYYLIMPGLDDRLFFEFDAKDQDRRKALAALKPSSILTVQGKCQGRANLDIAGKAQSVILFRNCEIVKPKRDEQ